MHNEVSAHCLIHFLQGNCTSFSVKVWGDALAALLKRIVGRKSTQDALTQTLGRFGCNGLDGGLHGERERDQQLVLEGMRSTSVCPQWLTGHPSLPLPPKKESMKMTNF